MKTTLPKARDGVNYYLSFHITFYRLPSLPSNDFFCQTAGFVSVAVLTASLKLLLSGQPACFWAISRLASTTRACSQPTNARGMLAR